MMPEQIKLVRENFEQIAPLADEVATNFYAQLFALDPGLRPLFKSDLTEQKKHLMMMLKFAVGTLDRLTIFEPSLAELGRRHIAYGVRDEHYDTVGNAFVLTLREMLGATLTSDLEAAWIAAYTTIAKTMRGGAARAEYQTAQRGRNSAREN